MMPGSVPLEALVTGADGLHGRDDPPSAAGLTERERLAESERRFRTVFVEAADAMFLLDDRRAILDANEAAEALFGRPVAALIGRRFDDLLADDPRGLEDAWSELRARGETKRDHRVKSGRGSRLVECRCRFSAHGTGHLCIARDITERRAIEERLVQAEKMESVGRLAGGIAHDFNNLLTAILGYTELLLANRASDDPERADIEEIQRAGQRAAGLTQQLLAYSRKQVLLPKDVDLSRTVLDLKRLLTRLIREDITLVCATTRQPAVVRIDPTQLEQIILNLVLNARDALPNGGTIRLEVARVHLEDADIPADQPRRSREYARLRVIDDGVGISAEALAHIFEPFFTTKELGKGTGLGLASVYGIVRQSQGFIGVDSEPGRGTAFTMHFPAAPVARDPDEARDVPPDPPMRETVLLVEDEDAVRVIVSAVLRRQGYRVIEASAPRTAIEMFERSAHDIDLLVTDVVMPEISGPALAQRLVGIRPELRVLFISGYADQTARLEGHPHVSFLGKPFHATALVEKVRDLLTS